METIFTINLSHAQVYQVVCFCKYIVYKSWVKEIGHRENDTVIFIHLVYHFHNCTGYGYFRELVLIYRIVAERFTVIQQVTAALITLRAHE